MLLDVIVIDDCNGFLFVTPSEGENQRLDSKALEFFLFLEIMTDSTVKSSSPFALFYLFIYVSNVYI